tara:strand:- start:141 stop:1505 length:1365 start_codon:yes stop_codon:yes gene_type:complete
MVFQNNVLLGAAGSGTTRYAIDQSIRFNDGDSAYMYKDFSGAGNQKQFTISLWLKRSLLGSRQDIWSYQQDVPIIIQADDTLLVALFGTTSLVTNRVFRDPNAWMHFVLTVDSTQIVSTERIRLYVNGQRETSFSTESYPSLNADANVWTSGLQLRLFRLYGGTNYYDGYAAEIHYLDGISYGPEFFGETTSNGLWVPKEYTGSYGSNGFKIDGRDSADLGDDESGNGNDFTTSGLTSANQVGDTPTDNHGVFNYLEKDLRYATTIANANKAITFTSGSSGWSGTKLGLYRSNGKAYAEFKLTQAYSFVNGDGVTVFVANDSNDSVSAGGGTGSSKLEAAYNAVDGSIYDGTSNQGTGTTWNTVNAVIGVYIDFDNGKGWFSKDGTVQTVNGTPNVETGDNPHFTFTANTTLTVGAGGVHYGTPGILILQNYAGEWATTPTSYTAFSTKAEGEA